MVKKIKKKVAKKKKAAAKKKTSVKKKVSLKKKVTKKKVAIKKVAKQIFIPLTVGGGIRTIDDISSILRAGADKISINTASHKNPKIITTPNIMISTWIINTCSIQYLSPKKFPKNP